MFTVGWSPDLLHLWRMPHLPALRVRVDTSVGILLQHGVTVGGVVGEVDEQLRKTTFGCRIVTQDG